MCMDNLRTGSLENVAHLEDESHFEYIDHDVTSHINVGGVLDEIYHFASLASPKDFRRIPILKVGALGTYNSLGLACAWGTCFMLASTSEIYGDPFVHPQREDYWSNVNPVGVRSVYDEAKRYAEAITMAYHRHHKDFIQQALLGRPLTVYGEGTQSRSVQYVDDLIEGVLRLMGSTEDRPVNIGNPVEYSVRQVAEMILEISGNQSGIVQEPLPEDDPKQRRPDITLARETLGWEPRVPAEAGLDLTFEGVAQSLRPSEAISAAEQ